MARKVQAKPRAEPRAKRSALPGGGSPWRRLKTYVARHVQNFVGTLGKLARHPFSAVMTVAVIGIALALPAGLHVLVLNAKALSGTWESAVDMSLYLKHDVPLDEAERLGRTVEAREDVSKVTVISADAALEEFRRLSGFGSSLDALTDNPLPIALVIRPAPDHDDPASVQSLGQALADLPQADLVQVDTEWVGKFQAILDGVRRAVVLAGVLFALGVVIIVGNTIRLDIQNRHAEIEVTKLVGGTDGFIRRPFLYTGFWFGVAGGLAAVGLVQASLALLHSPVQRIAGLYGSEFRLLGLDGGEIALVTLGGAVLGLVGSWLAATRHLRRIEPH